MPFRDLPHLVAGYIAAHKTEANKPVNIIANDATTIRRMSSIMAPWHPTAFFLLSLYSPMLFASLLREYEVDQSIKTFSPA